MLYTQKFSSHKWKTRGGLAPLPFPTRLARTVQPLPLSPLTDLGSPDRVLSTPLSEKTRVTHPARNKNNRSLCDGNGKIVHHGVRVIWDGRDGALRFYPWA